MHYKDGQPAQINDIVQGKGSNHAHPVQGVVVGLVAAASSCNLRLLMVDVVDTYQGTKVPMQVLEYGTVADFELLRRP